MQIIHSLSLSPILLSLLSHEMCDAFDDPVT